MKRDSAESNAVNSIMQKIILSHPEIAFKLIRDNKTELSSAGDGELYSAVYAVYGRDFSHDMIPVNYSENGISVKGYVVNPLYSKSNRSFQNFFINGRYVKSVTCSASLEEAYQNLVMTGKYPACVLMIDLPPVTVDVNVHPAKAEVRFSDEKVVFGAVYFAVKNALMESGLIYEFQFKNDISRHTDYKAKPFVPEKFEQHKIGPAEEKKNSPFAPVSGSDYAAVNEEKSSVYKVNEDKPEKTLRLSSSKAQYGNGGRKVFTDPSVVAECDDDGGVNNTSEKDLEGFSYINSGALKKNQFNQSEDEHKTDKPVIDGIKVIGEFFKNYIAAEAGDNIILIDKHAAHERIIFEKLRSQNNEGHSQLMISGAEILLSEAEYNAMNENSDILMGMGFDIDFSHEPFVRATAIPIILQNLNMDEVIPEIAENFLLNKRNPQTHRLDDMLHELACKAAIKANDKNDIRELQRLAEMVYYNENIRHCPHGRPVMFTLTKRELEKQFKRIV